MSNLTVSKLSTVLFVIIAAIWAEFVWETLKSNDILVLTVAKCSQLMIFFSLMIVNRENWCKNECIFFVISGTMASFWRVLWSFCRSGKKSYCYIWGSKPQCRNTNTHDICNCNNWKAGCWLSLLDKWSQCHKCQMVSIYYNSF